MCERRESKGGVKQRGGFTLVELLVVVSIMSMLMSILLPSLQRARETGHRVDCLSNLRSLTVVWMMYAMENNDKLCSADTLWNDAGGNHWVADGPMIPGNVTGGTETAIKEGVFWPFSQTVKLYKCKSDASQLIRSYALSRTMNGKTCNCEHDNIRPFGTLTEVRRPAERMVFIDASSKSKWIEGSFCPIEDVEAEPPQWFRSYSRNITARHSDGSNLSFADNHCEYRRYKDRRTVQLANWEIDAAEASNYSRVAKVDIAECWADKILETTAVRVSYVF